MQQGCLFISVLVSDTTCIVPPLQWTISKLSYDVCLEFKREEYHQLFCAVLCVAVVHSNMHTYEQYLNLHAVLGLHFCVFLFLLGLASYMCVFRLA